jgi:hypothetical protein
MVWVCGWVVNDYDQGYNDEHDDVVWGVVD